MVFKRSDFNALIDEVNSVITQPPGGCPPLDAIEHVPERTIWRKSHILRLHDALRETCPSISFNTLNPLWSQATIDEIRSKFSEAWCDCSCANCGPTEFRTLEPLTAVVVTYADADERDAVTALANPTIASEIAYARGECQSWILMWRDAVILARIHATVLSNFEAFLEELQSRVSPLEDEIEVLEDEIQALEAQLAGLPFDDPSRPAKQAELDDLHAILDEKEAELEELLAAIETVEGQIVDKRAEMEEQEELAETSLTMADTAAENGWALCLGDVVVGPTPRYTNIAGEMRALLGTHEYLSLSEGVEPAKCGVGYRVQVKSSSGEWVLSSTYLSGSFTPNGIPMPPARGIAQRPGIDCGNFIQICSSDAIANALAGPAIELRVCIDPPEC